MNKLEQLVPDLIKKQRKAAFLTVLFIILASVFGAAGYTILVVGLVIMEQNLVLYVTILVIGAVLGFAVCPCLVMAVFNVRANYIQMFTDKVSPILVKEKYFYGIFSYKIDLKQLKKRISRNTLSNRKQTNLRSSDGGRFGPLNI